MRQFNERIYDEEEIKDSPQVKDILKPRFQFNSRQREIYDWFVTSYYANIKPDPELSAQTELMLSNDSKRNKNKVKKRGRKSHVNEIENEEESCFQSFISDCKGQGVLTDKIIIKNVTWGEHKKTIMKNQTPGEESWRLFLKSNIFVSALI